MQNQNHWWKMQDRKMEDQTSGRGLLYLINPWCSEDTRPCKCSWLWTTYRPHENLHHLVNRSQIIFSSIPSCHFPAAVPVLDLIFRRENFTKARHLPCPNYGQHKNIFSPRSAFGPKRVSPWLRPILPRAGSGFWGWKNRPAPFPGRML